MEDTYVYVSVKLHLKPGSNCQEVVQECDYHFEHEDIIETEIVDILDTQVPAQVPASATTEE
jgi:hypothetical protein